MVKDATHAIVKGDRQAGEMIFLEKFHMASSSGAGAREGADDACMLRKRSTLSVHNIRAFFILV
jgi:hypothetical protein